MIYIVLKCRNIKIIIAFIITIMSCKIISSFAIRSRFLGPSLK